MDKYHQPILGGSCEGGHTDATNDDISRDGSRDGCHVDDDHDDDGSSVWRDVGGLYAHIPSRLHCSTTGSVQGRRDLDQERARALSLEMEQQRTLDRATHAPTLGDSPGSASDTSY